MTAWDDGRMIGAYGVHVLPQDDAGPCRAMMLDIMVAQDCQGRGLVQTLGTAAQAFARDHGAEVLCVVANERAWRAHARHFGWRLWADFEDWSASVPDTSGVADWRAFEGDVPDLRGREGPTYYPRSAEVLGWRLGENPRYPYRWLSDGVSRAAVKTFTDPTTSAVFGDIVGLFPPELEVYGSALGGVTAWFGAQGCREVVTCPVRASSRPSAEALGFRPTGRVRRVCGAGAAPEALVWGMLDVDVY